MNKFLNLVFLFLSDLLSPRSQAQSLASVGLEKLRTLTGILAAVIVGLIFFSEGFRFLLEDLRSVYTQQQTLGFSELAYIPLAIFLIVGVIFYLSFRKSAWGLEESEAKTAPPTPATFIPTPVAEALALLVHDIIEERQLNRQRKTSAVPSGDSTKSEAPEKRPNDL